jgi:hypothetical protein
MLLIENASMRLFLFSLVPLSKAPSSVRSVNRRTRSHNSCTIARAWCYRDDLIDDDLSLAFDAAMEIRQRSAAYGLFAKPGHVPLL